VCVCIKQQIANDGKLFFSYLRNGKKKLLRGWEAILFYFFSSFKWIFAIATKRNEGKLKR
jgi:hypothetical protein